MEKEEVKRLARTLKDYRDSQGLSQKQFAENSYGKISASYVRDIENGKTSRGGEISPTLLMLQGIAETMNVSLQELLAEIGVIRTYPLMYVTRSESKGLIHDLNEVLKKNQINIHFPVEDMTEIQQQELAEMLILLLDLTASKYKL